MNTVTYTRDAWRQLTDLVDRRGPTVLDELAVAEATIIRSPYSPPAAPHRRFPHKHKILLQKCKHYVHFIYNPRRQIITVLAVWSNSRGSEPFDPPPDSADR